MLKLVKVSDVFLVVGAIQITGVELFDVCPDITLDWRVVKYVQNLVGGLVHLAHLVEHLVDTAWARTGIDLVDVDVDLEHGFHDPHVDHVSLTAHALDLLLDVVVEPRVLGHVYALLLLLPVVLQVTHCPRSQLLNLLATHIFIIKHLQ